MGDESLHNAMTPREKEKGAAKGEKGAENRTGKTEGERSQKKRGRKKEQVKSRAVKPAEKKGEIKSKGKT